MSFHGRHFAPLALLLILLVTNWILLSSIKEPIRSYSENLGSSPNQGVGVPGFLVFPVIFPFITLNLTLFNFSIPSMPNFPSFLNFPNGSTSTVGQWPGGSPGAGQGGIGLGQGQGGGGPGSGGKQVSTGAGSTQVGQSSSKPREEQERPQRVIELNPVFLMVLIGIVLAVLAVFGIPRAITALKRKPVEKEKEVGRREKPPARPVTWESVSSQPMFPVAEVPKIRSRLLKLSIPEDMPPIWAPNEPLRFEAPQGTVVRARPAAEVGADYIRFPKEGCYEVEATLGNLVDKVTIKVVDYLEESSRMVLANFGSDPEKTVRELAVKVSGTRNIDISRLKPVVVLFEEALYGERGMDRARFEAFYRGLVSAFDRVRWVPCEEIGYFEE
ncbi:MAG: hypothetical protein JHC26_05690 [Thermofilum sp.]|jgi:hypothetical protein|uniref:hypothetical protein n=1 Tax=Thermofilum sp. TaxID=1961369 RepID=UPI00258759FC|nr:hypothetical protein [Thermofilum sp.]MCI4408564.1 hypothetical protein [Thermofilum sp.]